jgi:hypothetical protein
MDDRGDELFITDSRSCARAGRHVLSGLARAVYLACEAAPRRARLAHVLDRDFGLEASDDELAEVVGPLLRDRLVLEIDERLVSLALPAQVPAYPDYTQFPGGYVSAGRPDAESR